MRRLVIVIMLVAAILPAVSAQEQQQPPAGSATPAPNTPVEPAAPVGSPVAYTDREFPSWALKLRRAEIIAIGAFPLVYIFSGLGYDYTFYLGSGMATENVPWPVGPGTSQWTVSSEPELVQRKNLTLVGVSLGVSLLIAGADWLLGL